MLPCVYVVTSRKRGTLYIGVTSDLARRIWEHRNGVYEGFSKTHGAIRLVWYEPHDTMEGAITREKQMKKWHRSWKVQLIERTNSEWDDLYESLNR
jgi:putative endonuclease